MRLVTGVKSLNGSYGIFACKCGKMVSIPVLAMHSVVPSGVARATCSAPVTPEAPGRLSTITGWPRYLGNSCAITRAA